MDLVQYGISSEINEAYKNALKEYVNCRNKLLEIETFHKKTFICHGFLNNLVLGMDLFFKGLNKDMSDEEEVKNCFNRAANHFSTMKFEGYNGVRNLWAQQLFIRKEYVFLGGKSISLRRYLMVKDLKSKYEEMVSINKKLNSLDAISNTERFQLTEQFLTECGEFDELIKDNYLNAHNALFGVTKHIFLGIKIVLLLLNIYLTYLIFK